MKTKITLFLLGLTFIFACAPSGPEPIAFNKDACDYCKMQISEPPFAAQLITQKGRVYKFDDVKCMIAYSKSEQQGVKTYYLADFEGEHQLFDATNAWLVKSDDIKSPMGGNTVAFSTKEQAEQHAKTLQNASILTWSNLTR